MHLYTQRPLQSNRFVAVSYNNKYDPYPEEEEYNNMNEAWNAAHRRFSALAHLSQHILHAPPGAAAAAAADTALISTTPEPHVGLKRATHLRRNPKYGFENSFSSTPSGPGFSHCL